MFPGNILTTKSFEANDIEIDFIRSASENYFVNRNNIIIYSHKCY